MKLVNASNVLLVTVLVVSVNSGCVVRDRRETTSDDASVIGGGITGFLSNLRCNIQSGAQQVKKTVEGGLDYVRKRFNNDNENIENDKNINENIQNDADYDNVRSNNGTTMPQNSDRIIFMNEDEENVFKQIKKSVPILPIVNVSAVSTRPVTIGEINTSNVTIGDRNAISAPIVCPKGQRLVEQKCVPIVEF